MSDVVRLYELESTVTPGKVCQLVNDGKIQDLPLLTVHEDVYSTTVTMADALQLPDNFNYKLTLDYFKLSDGRLLFNYLYSNTLYCIYVTISGTTMTIGITMTLALDTGTNSIKLYYVSDNRLMLSYLNYQSSTYYQRIAAILISADNIMALGTYKEIAYFGDLAKLIFNDAKTYIYVFYRNSNDYWYVTSYLLSSITLTQVQTTPINILSSVSVVEILRMNENEVVIIFKNSSDLTYYYTQEINLYYGRFGVRYQYKTDIIAKDDILPLAYSNGGDTTMVQWINESMFLQAYATYVNSVYYLTFRLIQVLPSSAKIQRIKVLCETVLPASIPNVCNYFIKMYKLNSKQIQVFYETYVSSTYTLWYFILTYDDVNNVFTASTKVAVYENQINFLNIISMIPPNPCLLFYIKSVSPYNMFLRYFTNQISVAKEVRSGKNLGVAVDASGAVLLKGIYKGFTNLVIGAKYYFNNSTGVISTTSANGTYLGVAIDSNELLINDTLI